MVLSVEFKGFMAPVFTPFSRLTGELDLRIIKKYADYLISNGIHGVLVNGTLGEGVCMSVQERKTVLEAWIEASKTLPLHVMVHVGGLGLRDVQELARHAEAKGAHSILSLPDLFHRPKSIEEIVHYLTLVSQAAPKTPLLYYHYPEQTGVTLDMSELLKAGRRKVPTLAGLKFTHNNLVEGSQCLQVDNGEGGNFTVFLGNDYLIHAALCEGFESLITTTLNMFGPTITDINHCYKNSQVIEARDKQLELNKCIEIILEYGKWVPAMKEAMHIITGLDFGVAREPQGVLTSTQVKLLREELHSSCPSLNLIG